jgi:hypothetical protein
MFSTLVLTFTIIGMLLVYTGEVGLGRTTWMSVGYDLINTEYKKKQTIVLFIAWVLFTIVLTCSIIGMLLFVPKQYEESTWMTIGKNLKNKIIII